MIAPHTSGPGRVFVTGASGFIGHHVLAELLSRGVPCAALLRPDINASVRRLRGLLDALGIGLDRQVRDGRLLLLEGDINGVMPRALGANITSLLHIAACTAFDRKPNGDPARTNVQGTGRLLAWASQRGIRELHLVSTAYRCGVTEETVGECIDPKPPVFNNDYEQSKWQAEHDARAWALKEGATLTVYRPSIVVGHRGTGRTTSFGGFYVMARATQVLAQSFDGDAERRRATGVRVVGRADACQNLVPVDYVATMIAHAVADERHHGRVYHLTHPTPPTNGMIKSVVDGYFDVAGSDFIEPDELDRHELSTTERLFYDASRPVRAYMTHTPVFDRGNTKRLEAAAGVRCFEYAPDELRALIRYAEAVRWGREASVRGRDRSADLSVHDESIGAYFEHYMPAHVAESEVARRTAMTVTARFVVSDVPCAWRCRFVAGRLVHSERATTRAEPVPGDDFVYTTTRGVFWEAAAGLADPQRVFLEDRVRVTGDVETALKMAMVLQQFNREFPCTPGSIDQWLCKDESAGCAAGPRGVAL